MTTSTPDLIAEATEAAAALRAWPSDMRAVEGKITALGSRDLDGFAAIIDAVAARLAEVEGENDQLREDLLYANRDANLLVEAASRLKEAEEALKFYADPISHMTTPTSEELKALIALVEARRDWLSWYFAKHPERSIPAPEDIELYGRLSSALTALKCEIEEMREAAANIKNVNTVTDILNEEVRKVLAETRTSLSVAKGALQRISELSFKRAGVYAVEIARQALASIPQPDIEG